MTDDLVIQDSYLESIDQPAERMDMLIKKMEATSIASEIQPISALPTVSSSSSRRICKRYGYTLELLKKRK